MHFLLKQNLNERLWGSLLLNSGSFSSLPPVVSKGSHKLRAVCQHAFA